MGIAKPKSLLARLVTAGTAGFLIAVGLFAVLFQIVDIPYEPGIVAKPAPPNFRRHLVETTEDPDKIVRPPKPTRDELTALPTPTDTTETPDPIDRPDSGLIPNGPPFDPTRFGNRPGSPGGIAFSSGTDQDVIKVVGIPPEYPASALRNGTEGWVRVRFTITPTGSVQDAVVVSAAPRGVFNEAALTAIARWRYRPRFIDGTAVERVGVETLIEFRITE